METKNILSTKFLKWLSFGVLIIVALLLVFQLGISVGYHKANFAIKWAQNYKRDFGGPRMGMFGIYTGNNFMYGHGVLGTIAKITPDSIVIRSADNSEKIVNIDSDTVLNQAAQNIKLQDLKTDQQVIVIGSPNQDGTIDAKIIRVFPE
ncbi:hypothetical protein KGQ24_03235 [Patescibacteria group bacterium]|nr:hypothetical protein [Patescibacteria group bacterium]